MARIFWVKCPKCGEKFYAHTMEFRGTGREMRCPFCAHFFKDSEAVGLWDSGLQPEDW